MKFKDFKEKLLKESKFRDEYYSRDLSFEVSGMIAKARILKGLTQEKLAKLMNKKQSSIARAENGSYLPSLRYLQEMAEAMDTYLIPPKFGFMESDFTIYHQDDIQSYNEIKNLQVNTVESEASGREWGKWVNDYPSSKKLRI